jgi:hypothetical protein
MGSLARRQATFHRKNRHQEFGDYVAAIRFGPDSPQYYYACARRDEVMKEEMNKGMEREFQEEHSTSG